MTRKWGLLQSAAALTVMMGNQAFAQTGLPATGASSPPEPAATSSVLPANTSNQITAAVPGSGRVEDIVVTAQRRSENLQHVPISVTAVTSAALARTAIRDVTDLSSVVPGLNIASEIGFVTSQLRGVGSNLVSVGYENPVAIYVDGVYYASPSASVVNLNNVERVEVLKGPQGTLFGRNATGGLINIVTKDPSHTFGGAVNASYGNYQTVAGDLYLTGGLTDTIAVDLAVQGSTQGKGWGTNQFDGKDNYKVDHDLSARSKLVFESGGTRVALSGDYSDYKNSLNTEVLYPGTYSAYAGGPITYKKRYNSNTNQPHILDGYNFGGSLQLEQDIGFARLRTISAYRRDKLLNVVDIDETPTPALAFRLQQRDRQFSQEVQLLSTGKGPFTWVAGGYYFQATGKWNPFSVTLGQPISPFSVNVNSFDTIGTKSLSGYAQATLAVADHTKLTLGGRYTDESRSRKAVQLTQAGQNFLIPAGPGVTIPVSAGDPLGPPQVFPKSKINYKRLTYRAAIDHEFTSDVLGYASVNRGFKSGGYNPAIYDQALLVGGSSYQPERLDAYEIGFKSSLLDRHVRLNVAAFLYNYSNVQLPFIIQTTVLTINGAKARIYGVDGDLEARVTDALRLTGGFQIISDKYVSFPSAPIGTKRGGIPLTVGSAKGNRLNFVPSVTLNGGFDYTFANVAGGSLVVSGNAAYNSGYYMHPDNVQRQGSFVIINSTVRWTSPSGFALGVYGKNLGNVQRIASFVQSAEGDQDVQWAAPRTFGVTAGFRF